MSARQGVLQAAAIRSPAIRFRLVAYVLVAVLAPVLLAGWIFLGPARDSEVQKADAALEASLHSVVGEFSRFVDEAEIRAMSLASAPRVRRAFARGERGRLIELGRNHPNAAFIWKGEPTAGRIDGPSVTRTVAVVGGQRKLGEVVVGIPLDGHTAARLRRAAGLPPDIVLAFSRQGRIDAESTGLQGEADLPLVTPAEVRLGDSTFRALATSVTADPDGVGLVVLKPNQAIYADVEQVRRRIFAAVGGVVAGIALVAYALAPAISRSRLALADRAQAALVLSHVADGIFLIDRRGVIVSWNPAAEIITGLRADSVRGRRVDEAIPGWSEVASRVAISASDGERLAPQMVPITIGSRELWLSISGVEFPEGIVFAFRDITEEQRVSEWKSDFVAIVSHELRTPLSSIHGAAMTLRRATGRLVKANATSFY